jgi:hypothetical protein
MKQVRSYIELRQGEKVGMLFTPRLYTFKGEQGVDFMSDNTLQGIYSLYADVMYCAALNLWTLEGKDKEDAPFTRVDFHAFSVENPKAFGKAMNTALLALTGKSLEDFIAEGKKAQETGGNASNMGEPVKKKNLLGWITRLLNRS